MKVLIVCAFIAVVRGTALYAETGVSSVQNSQDNLGNYAFGYDETHLSGGTFRKEVGDSAGNKIGSYGLRDADGRQRIVNYIADAAGFRANIRSNEPGVGATAQDPAHTSINKDAIIVAAAAPAVSIAAPVAAVAPAPAAVAVSAPLAEVVESDSELTQAVDSPLPYSAGALHYSAATPVVATKSVATHAVAGHAVVAPVHYGAHYAAGIAPITSHVGHYAAAPISTHVSHYAGAPISTHVAHYAGAPLSSHVAHYAGAPISTYSTSIQHSLGHYGHPALSPYVY